MPGFRVWDVVKVPFPYTNCPVQQRRPALVVACHGGEAMPMLLWVVMITSAAHRRWPHDVTISDTVEAGLPAPSIVRPTKIATMEAGNAEWSGRLPGSDRHGVASVLSTSLQEVHATPGQPSGVA